MSWILGGVTLKSPSDYEPKEIEVGSEQVTLGGKTVKDIVKQKMVHVLTFSALTRVQVAQLKSLYNQKTALAFSVSDGSFSISSVQVLMKISGHKFNYKGSEYREDVKIELTEVE